jgi:hypothetical protein
MTGGGGSRSSSIVKNVAVALTWTVPSDRGGRAASRRLCSADITSSHTRPHVCASTQSSPS